MDVSTEELMTKGMAYLIERLGIVDAQRFISIIKREGIELAEWRKAFAAGNYSELLSDETDTNHGVESGI